MCFSPRALGLKHFKKNAIANPALALTGETIPSRYRAKPCQSNCFHRVRGIDSARKEHSGIKLLSCRFLAGMICLNGGRANGLRQFLCTIMSLRTSAKQSTQVTEHTTCTVPTLVNLRSKLSSTTQLKAPPQPASYSLYAVPFI